MKNKYSNSIKLNFVAIFCFFLPFFYTGCESSTENSATDSTAVQVLDQVLPSTASDSNAVNDSSSTNFNEDKSSSNVSDSTTDSSDDKENVSLLISKKYPILSFVLVSQPNTYSGVAMIINNMFFISYYAITVSFLLLLISLLIKYIEPLSRKSIVIIEILALIALAFSSPSSWTYNILWGYWISLIFVVSLTAYDFYVLNVLRRNPKSNNI